MTSYNLYFGDICKVHQNLHQSSCTIDREINNYSHFTSILIGHLLSGVPDYFDRNKISSGGDLSHYSSASLY